MSISENLSSLLRRMPASVQLVAVSKTKPAEALMEAYNCRQRNFGENYVQELTTKAAVLPNDIRWHLIGHLQSNKVSNLIRDIPHLWMVETVDSLKLADLLNKACLKQNRPTPLKILIEVATSTEDSKSGVAPSELKELALFVSNQCQRLELCGLMTIADPSRTNECFEALKSLSEDLKHSLGYGAKDFVLSMGMSGDWEEAVQRGSNQVRIGSSIFGSR